ncbi:MAG: hypothetical protein ABW328_18835 [Ilumatobacteraceae bacterium]
MIAVVHGTASTTGEVSAGRAAGIDVSAYGSPPLSMLASRTGPSSGSRESGAGPLVTVHPAAPNTVPSVTIAPAQSAGVAPTRLALMMLLATMTALVIVATSRPAEPPARLVVLSAIVMWSARSTMPVPGLLPETWSAPVAADELASTLTLVSCTAGAAAPTVFSSSTAPPKSAVLPAIVVWRSSTSVHSQPRPPPNVAPLPWTRLLTMVAEASSPRKMPPPLDPGPPWLSRTVNSSATRSASPVTEMPPPWRARVLPSTTTRSSATVLRPPPMPVAARPPPAPVVSPPRRRVSRIVSASPQHISARTTPPSSSPLAPTRSRPASVSWLPSKSMTLPTVAVTTGGASRSASSPLIVMSCFVSRSPQRPEASNAQWYVPLATSTSSTVGVATTTSSWSSNAFASITAARRVQLPYASAQMPSPVTSSWVSPSAVALNVNGGCTTPDSVGPWSHGATRSAPDASDVVRHGARPVRLSSVSVGRV